MQSAGSELSIIRCEHRPCLQQQPQALFPLGLTEIFLTRLILFDLLMSVPLRREWRWGVAARQKDKAPIKWPQSEGGDSTEGSVLGWLL